MYETNYSNVEQILLQKYNVEETLRLALRNAFREEDPDLTAKLSDLYLNCPSLFTKVLSRADQQAVQDELLDDDFVVDVTQSADDDHRDATAINAIPWTQVRNAPGHPINEGATLPGQPTDTGRHAANPSFRRHTRLAYEKDYGKGPFYPSVFEKRKIQWCRKFGFTDRYVPKSDQEAVLVLAPPRGHCRCCRREAVGSCHDHKVVQTLIIRDTMEITHGIRAMP